MWCCWVVGKDKTFDFFANPDKADVFDISHCSKLTVSELPEVLETALLLPLEIAEKMAVVEVFDSEGNTELALAVGSNYQGIMPVDIIDIISRFFFDGRHPTWALNGPCTDVESESCVPFSEMELGLDSRVPNPSVFTPHRRTMS